MEYRIVSCTKIWHSTIIQDAGSFEEALEIFRGDKIGCMDTEEIAHWSPEVTKIERNGKKFNRGDSVGDSTGKTGFADGVRIRQIRGGWLLAEKAEQGTSNTQHRRVGSLRAAA